MFVFCFFASGSPKLNVVYMTCTPAKYAPPNGFRWFGPYCVDIDGKLDQLLLIFPFDVGQVGWKGTGTLRPLSYLRGI